MKDRYALLKNLLTHVRDEMAQSLSPEAPDWFPITQELINYLDNIEEK